MTDPTTLGDVFDSLSRYDPGDPDDWRRPPLSDLDGWRAFLARVRAWEEANPELAAAWREAAAENEARDTDADNRREDASLAMHLEACGVGRLTVGAVVGPGFRATPAVAAVAEWLASGSTFLLLVGGAGTGKTVAAANVLREARVAYGAGRYAYSAEAGLFVRAAGLARALFTGDERGLLERARRVPWLIVDEVGGEYADVGGRWLAEFEDLLDARHEARRRTILTSNLTTDELRTRLGDRIRSRIAGAGRIVSVGREDLRRVRP